MPGCGSASDVMKTRSLLLLCLLLAVPVAHTETDPLVSLFNFQMRMAEGGNVKAMMKVGEMYENGEGTPRDYDKALEMYRRARAKGEPSADAAIRRVEAKRRRAASRAGSAASPMTPKAGASTPQKHSTQAKPVTQSSRKAAQERARREAAQQKARKEAAARKAAQERARREAAARKAAQEKARREAAARQARQRQEQARREAAARKAEPERVQSRTGGAESTPAASETASTPEPATPARSDSDTGSDTKKFSSDPCKTRAARFLSSCKKK